MRERLNMMVALNTIIRNFYTFKIIAIAKSAIHLREITRPEAHILIIEFQEDKFRKHKNKIVKDI